VTGSVRPVPRSARRPLTRRDSGMRLRYYRRP
jgi:hypothetical protein